MFFFSCAMTVMHLKINATKENVNPSSRWKNSIQLYRLEAKCQERSFVKQRPVDPSG